MTIEVNLVTDFGAVGDGVAGDGPAFDSFRAWGRLQTEPIELTIPGGRYLMTPNTNFTQWFCDGILQPLTILGYGATLRGAQFGSLGGIMNRPANIGLFHTAVYGASTITLITLADTAKFAANRWVYISALDLQGFGEPPNHQLFEFNYITSVNASTGEITLAEPLTNTYKSTYPLFQPGNNFNPSQGGPATIWQMYSNWGCQNFIYGLTLEGAGLTSFKGIECLFEDCSFIGQGHAPTATRVHTLRNCSVATVAEFDKGVEQLYIYDCHFAGDAKVQSSSIKYMLVDGCTFEDHLNGTPLNCVIRNSTIASLIVGPIAYGTAESLTLENCVIPGTIRVGGTQVNYTSYLYSNGVMSRLKSAGVPQIINPGGYFIHGGAGEKCGEIFRILDIREDGTNIYIDTTMPDPVIRPPSPFGDGGVGGPARTLFQYYGPNITATNCTGGFDAISLSDKGTRPAWAYYQKTITGDYNTFGVTPSPPAFQSFGRLERITIDVTRAYTGILSTYKLIARQQNTAFVIFADNTWARNWGFTINLKIAGTRVITPSGNTGFQTGDSVSTIPAGGIWCPAGQLGAFTSASIAAEPEPTWAIVTITYEMAHEIPAAQIAEVGAYNLEGADAVLTQSQHAKIAVAPAGSYSLTGQDIAAATSAGPKLITVDAAAYALAGSDSEIREQIRIRDMKISELGPAVALDGSELLPVVQNGVTVQAPISAIRDLPTYSVVDVPSAEDASQGAMIYVTNGNAGAECMAVSDGVYWRVIALGTIISP